MIALLAALQVSLFGARLHREPEPPEVRAAAHLLLLHEEAERVPPTGMRTRAEALSLAAELRASVERGVSFPVVVARHSEARNALTGGVLGSFVPGVLDAQLDRFLFAAEEGELSAPIDAASGVHLVQRLPARVGVRQILIDRPGERGRLRAEELLSRLRAGSKFGELAAEYSADPVSRRHRGAYSIFERGANDRLLKRVAFDSPLGEVVGPLQSPLGWHLLQPVDPSAVPTELAETRFLRLRALLIAHEGSQGSLRFEGRSEGAALVLASELRTRILAGESMEELAREWNDDPGGRERGGDVGWVHRGTPGLPAWIGDAWQQPVGWLSEWIATPAGFVLLRREA